MDGMDVVLIRWPGEVDRLDAARSAGAPRLLLVDAAAEPPATTVDPLEDWTRMPADPNDVQVRVSTLARRADGGELPAVDDDGLLHHQGRWVALSPLETAIARALTERYRAVVGRDLLARRAWPAGVPTRNALDVQMVRFRRRVEPVGLEVRTVRSRGYLLQSRVDVA